MLRKYRDWQRGEFVVVGADTAAGGLDYSAAVFLSKTNLDLPLIYHSQAMATEMTPILHLELERIYDQTGVKPVVAPETNNGGSFEIERLATLNRNSKYVIYQQKKNVGTTDSTENSVKLGWTTSSATRPTMLQMLKEAIDNRLLTIWDKPLVNEMFAFIISQTSSSWKAQAEQGAHDDLIMALAIAWQLYQSENPFVKPVRTRQPRKRVSLHL
jgi:phage terminase large subunit